jgi:hypothetical protein
VAADVTSPLVVPIAEALAACDVASVDISTPAEGWLPEAEAAAAAVVAYVASLPHDYTATDVWHDLTGDAA